MLRIASMLAALALLSPAGSASSAGDPTPGELTLETERVVVFKNGYALFVKRASGTADPSGMVHTGELPDSAVLGTLWALAERNGEILSMRAEWIDVEERRGLTPCLTVRDLLRANVGRKVDLELADEKRIGGRIAEVLELEPRPPGSGPPAAGAAPTAAPPPHRSVAPRLNVVTSPTPVPRGGDLVAIDLAGGERRVLPIVSIHSVSGAELVTRHETVVRPASREKRLSVGVGERAAGRPVTIRLIYFTPNVRWIPTYRLAGDLESSARLSLQGEILNEAESIEDAALDLVVGVPNFRFDEVVSPLSLERTLRHTLRETAPSIMGQGGMSNVMRQQRVSEWRTPRPEDEVAMEGLPEMSAAGEQDLFVYSVPSFSLKRGGRATVALWQRDVALDHLYTLDIRTVRHGSSGSNAWVPSGPPDVGDASPLRLEREQVWHQLELANDSDVPWTTGAVLLMRETLPLGQELLTYTSAGGETLVPVTVAVDVRASHRDVETERQPNALSVGGYTYTLIRKEGTIDLRSFRTEPTRIRVRVSFGGRGEGASDGGEIRINDFRADDWEQQRYLINQHTDIEWTIELVPGESRTLTYDSSFYVR
jgi:hypothetical protein